MTSSAGYESEIAALRAALIRLLWNSVADDAVCSCETDDICPECQATEALGLGRWMSADWASNSLPTRN